MAEDVTLHDLGSFAINYYWNVAAFTLLVYDYFLTLVPEVERFWRSRTLNWATGFFYFNRYVSLLGHAPVMMEFFWTTKSPSKIALYIPSDDASLPPQASASNPDLHISNFSSCHSLQSYHQYLAIVIQLVVACMMIMRIYALYECSLKVLAFQIGFAVLAVAVGCWAVLGAKKEKYPDVLIPIGCASSLSRYQATRLGAAWGGMLVFDTLVFGMTVYKALSIPRTKEITLLTVLLRDGAVYFCVMVASNLGNMLTFMLGSPWTRGVTTTFTNVISSIMISRLMLNLRHPSLVSQIDRGSLGTTDELTYPNLTFLEPAYTTAYSEPEDLGALSQSDLELEDRPGRARSVYAYLAGESIRKIHDHDSIELSDRHRPLV